MKHVLKAAALLLSSVFVFGSAHAAADGRYRITFENGMYHIYEQPDGAAAGTPCEEKLAIGFTVNGRPVTNDAQQVQDANRKAGGDAGKTVRIENIPLQSQEGVTVSATVQL